VNLGNVSSFVRFDCCLSRNVVEAEQRRNSVVEAFSRCIPELQVARQSSHTVCAIDRAPPTIGVTSG
jgi:hypothetical protein